MSTRNEGTCRCTARLCNCMLQRCARGRWEGNCGSMDAIPATPDRESSNERGRRRDALLCWLLERHPATAGMLVGIGLFRTVTRSRKRLRRLVGKKCLRVLGTVSLGSGRPEHVYGRGRGIKSDNLLHDVQLSRVCFKLQVQEIRRGKEVDSYLRPDAELFIGGRRFLLEYDAGTIGYRELIEKRFRKYLACDDLVLWVCPTAARMEGLRRRAELIRGIALFTTLEQVLANPHGPIWVDFDGGRAALPAHVPFK
jgi:hypothetical protein